MTSRTADHRAPVLPGLVAALALSTLGSAQQEVRPSPYLQALQRAIADAQGRALLAIDVWEDHSTWENAWVARTDHFAVRTTHSHGMGMQIAQGLESMLGHFGQALGSEFVPEQRFQVHLFPDVASYNRFGEEHGQEHSSFYGCFHADQHPDKPVAATWHENATWLRMQVTHGVVHQYLDAAWPGEHPAWVVEGLAAYFSIYWDYNWGLAQLDQLKQEDQLLPLRRLLADPIAAYGENTHARLMQLGMLFYYLLRYREDTRTTGPGEEPQRAPFRDYLNAVLEGRDVTGLPVHRLLEDPATLDRDFRAYEFPR